MSSDHPIPASGPLSGLRVIEMGSFIAGPFCGQLLADLGADVIKIEPPRKGDAMREWGAARKNGETLWWSVIARNKRSLALDLRGAEGQKVVSALLGHADILVENFRPGTLEKWGLAPDSLMARNPRLIVARVSGFGQTGPWAGRTGFGAIAEAMAGLRHLGGFADRPPVRTGLSVGDSLAGMFTCIGVLAALHERDKSGQGQVVDVGITDAVLAISESILAEFSATGAVRGRTGTSLPRIAPSNIYPVAGDGWVLIAANGDAIFRRLARAMGQPALCDDPRFATHMARGDNQQVLDQIIADWTARHTESALLALMEDHAIPAGPICTAADVHANPHFRARGAVVDIPTQRFGSLTMQGVVPRLSRTPGAIRWDGPQLGEHTDQILGSLGYGGHDIEALRAKGTI
ncbi:MAG: CoA transferase [Rhodobacteraceae bacterium]|nr:CoA transferase [Paracoccaceae bacterium]